MSILGKAGECLKSLYVLGRNAFDRVLQSPMNFNTKVRSISIVQLTPDKQVSRHDITVDTTKNEYTESDIHEFIEKSQVELCTDPETKHFIEFVYHVTNGEFKFLTMLPVDKEKNKVFPVYSAKDLEEFHTESEPNGVLISSVNDVHDITDELHKYSGPKGNFYADSEGYPGFKLDWIKLLVPDVEIDTVKVEILSYHGKQYLFTNDEHAAVSL